MTGVIGGATSGALLQAQGLVKHYGGVHAVDGAGITVAPGQIHALIGPNGAGKTTFVGLLSGRITADAGQISLGGQDITRLPAHARVRLGIGYTFQVTSIFPGLSVFDNVALAAQGGRLAAANPGPAAHAALAKVGLSGLDSTLAGDLSYGHQRLLELAMGLALRPKLLILDEPTQGLAGGEVAGFIALVKALVPGIAILLIEHNMEVVMALADQITVLVAGRVLAAGPPAQIRADAAVQEAYLGA